MTDKKTFEIRFLVSPKLAYGRRLCIVGALVAGGVALQVAHVKVLFVVGTALVFSGALHLLSRRIANEPRIRGKKVWQPVTMDRWERVLQLDRQCRRWQRSFLSATSASGVLLGLAVIAACIWAGSVIGTRTGSDLYRWAWYMDGSLLFGALWLSGGVSAWRPKKLIMVIKTLMPWARELERLCGGAAVVQPMLEVKKSRSGELPTGARLFVRWGDAQGDFLGLQVQVSLNYVQGRPYPYLYAVLVAKKGFCMREKDVVKKMRSGGDVIQFEDEEDVEVVVIRQRTTRGSGYHTKRAHQRRIVEKAAATAVELAS